MAEDKPTASWKDLLAAAEVAEQEAFKKERGSLWYDIWKRRAKHLRIAGEQIRNGTPLANVHFDNDDLLRAAEHPPEGTDPVAWAELLQATDRKYKQLATRRV